MRNLLSYHWAPTPGPTPPTPTPFTPWVNTVFYFPFEEDADDYSGNWQVLTTPWVQQAIGRQFTWKVTMNKATYWIFASFWVKVDQWWSWWSSVFNQVCLWQIRWSMNYQIKYTGDSSSDNKIFYWYTRDTWFTRINVGAELWQWTHIVLCPSTTQWFCYINWEKHTMASEAPYNYQDSSVNFLDFNTTTPWTVTLSDVIVENRTWSDEEILTYFNETKSKYWVL